MRDNGDATDPARDIDTSDDPGRVMRWLRLAAEVVERRAGGGKKGGERAVPREARGEDEERGKTAT